MNILYLGKKKRNDFSGIEKKIYGQIDAFRSLGHGVWFLYTEPNSIWLEKENGTTEKLLDYSENMISIYGAYEKATRIVAEKYSDKIDMCYIRKPLATWMHLKALKKLHQIGWKVVEEIPTFPYDSELIVEKGVKSKIYLWVDRLFRPFLSKNIDYFTTYSEHEKIWGREAIQLQNGIDVKSVKKRIPKCKGDLHLLTVSTMCPWHGYDRLIKGLSTYYKEDRTVKVYIDMVGDGTCCKEWKELAQKLNVGKYVIFHGKMGGAELENMFERCQIAVSSLGLSRLGLSSSSVLKNREYVASGIPIVYANEDQGLRQIDKYCFKVSDDEKEIDMLAVVRFTESLHNYEQIANSMREYAEQKFTWESQMKKVIDRI